MRTIKFRGKTLKGEWIFGYYIEFELCDGEGRCSYIKKDGCQPIKVTPETVGQFTGLLDKNGREIYEGDFVKIQWNFGEESVEEISYSVEYAYWMYGNNPLCEIIGEECCYEVTGNVHDNPELLKGGKP